MNHLLFAVLGVGLLSLGAGPVKSPPPPRGLKLVPLAGQKGFIAPEGIKAEIVRDKLGDVAWFAFSDTGSLCTLGSAGPLELADMTIKGKEGPPRKVTVLRSNRESALSKFPLEEGTQWADKAQPLLSLRPAGGFVFDGDSALVATAGQVIQVKAGKEASTWERTTVVQGLGGARTSLALGVDGWLYIASSAGDHDAQGSDGSRASALRTGAVFRCRPDGSRLHLFALGLHDPGQPAFDAFGNLFLIDGGTAHGEAFASARLLHVTEGADFGYRLAPGERLSVPDPVRACWAGEKPWTLGAVFAVGAGPAVPLCVYADERLPELYRGLVLQPDARGRRVRAYRLLEEGATFRVEEEFNILEARAGDFQPAQVAVGPDGALYILDRSAGGRVWRLTWAGTKDEEELKPRSLSSWAETAKLADADLVKALQDDEGSIRDIARRELVRRGDKNRDAVIGVLLSGRAAPTSQLAALGALGTKSDEAVLKAMREAVENGEAEVRALAASLLGLLAKEGDRETHNALLTALAEDSVTVKRAVALAMGRIRGPAAADNVATALSFDESKGPHLPLSLIAALDRFEATGVKALVGLADSGGQKDIDKVADLYRALRTPVALASLPALLRNPHLSMEQRADLVRAATRDYGASTALVDELAVRIIDDPKLPQTVQVALLQALAAPGVKLGNKTAAWVVARITDEDAELRLPALAVAAHLAPEGGEERLLTRLKREGLTEQEKAALARALGSYRSEATTTALLELVKEAGAVGPAALLALPADKASPVARKWLTSGKPTQQRAAVAALARDPVAARELAELALKGKVPALALPDLTTALRRLALKDVECAKKLTELTR